MSAPLSDDQRDRLAYAAGSRGDWHARLCDVVAAMLAEARAKGAAEVRGRVEMVLDDRPAVIGEQVLARAVRAAVTDGGVA